MFETPFLHRHKPVSHKRAAKLAAMKIIDPKNMTIVIVEAFASARMGEFSAFSWGKASFTVTGISSFIVNYFTFTSLDEAER